MLVYLVKLCSYTSLTLLVPPDSETTTLKRMDVTTKKPASLPPYVINTGENQDITPKFSKYSTRNPHLSFLSNQTYIQQIRSRFLLYQSFSGYIRRIWLFMQMGYFSA